MSASASSSIIIGPDPIISAALSPSRDRPEDEHQPLLGDGRPPRKPFHRARPLWLVPFVIVASLTRGMTLAPRVEVYTQLSCSALHGHWNHTSATPTDILSYGLPAPAILKVPAPDPNDPRSVPSTLCVSDPAVQARAARLQTLMTTTMGGLSALTTGWWGRFGARHGRTRVLAIATLGWFLTDLIFILVSTPHSIFAGHGHKLLLLSPVLEGLLGGWSTLQSATAAYVSDCTSDGSRSHIFSRFTGAFYIGLAVGPMIGAALIRQHETVTSVFWAAIAFSCTNLVLAAVILPESLHPDTRATHKELARTKPVVNPLRVLLPAKGDWSLTMLSLALFGFYLSVGVYQLKYLFAGHMYGWGAETLSYYISWVGALRAGYLLLGLPLIISAFKPKAKPSNVVPAVGAGKKDKPKPKQLLREIVFDLRLTRFQLFIDILCNVLVAISPSPNSSHSFTSSSSFGASHAQALFVAASSLSSFGAGVVPTIQSLALCLLQARAAKTGDTVVEAGSLFGALAVVQAVGSMILGPVLFGLVYSVTVAQLPQAIFILAGSLLFVSLILVWLVRPPAVPRVRIRRDGDVERGRSRVSKDLSRGTGYGAISSSASFGSGSSSGGGLDGASASGSGSV